MKYLGITLKGYIGIFNGLGVHEVNIDLNNSNSIVLITGPNGGGKSTILNAIHLNPDPASCFIKGYPAEKHLTLLDRGIVYQIHIIHSITKSGTRSTPVISFQKIMMTGEVIELNPSGLVGSYTEAYANEFEMDPNYFVLSTLSSSNRGLADKTPAQRKKYVGSVTGSVEFYNNINKIFVKKSQVLKSTINSLNSKLMTIGDYESLEKLLATQAKQLNSLEEAMKGCIKQVGYTEAQLSTLDPGGNIQSKHESILGQFKQVLLDLETANSKLVELRSKSSNANGIETKKFISKIEAMIVQETHRIESAEKEIANLLNKQTEDANVIMLKQAKIDSLNMDEYDSLKETISNYKREIDQNRRMLANTKDLQIDLSKEELIETYENLLKIRDIIFNLRSNSFSAFKIHKNLSGMVREYENLEHELQVAIRELEKLEKDVVRLESLQSDKPPKSCKENKCPFLIKSKELSTLFKQSILDRDEKVKEIDTLRKTIISLEESYRATKSVLPLLDLISKYSYQIKKIPNLQFLLNNDILFEKIENGYLFNEITDMTDYIQNIDLIMYTRNLESKLKEFESDMRVYQERISIIDEIQSEIDALNNGLDETIKNISLARSIYSTANDLISNYNSMLVVERSIDSLEEKIYELETIRDSLKSEAKGLSDNMELIRKYVVDRSNAENKILELRNQIEPVKAEMEKTKYSLTLVHSYTDELEEVKNNYKFIEALKTMSSSTSGIQTLYMRLYMNDTLSLANSLLSNLFRGGLELLPYVINEDEFRIPFRNTSGLDVDDISSGSTSQICMVGMIISFALMMQNSNSHYNVISLDEIDGGLDTENRLEFATVLSQLMQMLGVEQVFIISHNSELIGLTVTNVSITDLVA